MQQICCGQHSWLTIMATSSGKIEASLISTFPVISIIIGVIIVIVELVVIGLALISPQFLGLLEDMKTLESNETVILSSGQRTGLGITTVLIIIEAIVFGCVQTYAEYKRTLSNLYLIQSGHQNHPDNVVSYESISPSSAKPLIQNKDGPHSKDFFTNQPYLTPVVHGVPLTDIDSTLRPVLRDQIAHYIAEIVFDVVDFLWKWTLAILVIRNNWTSVVIAIAGGLGYPVMKFWRIAFSSPKIPVSQTAAASTT